MAIKNWLIRSIGGPSVTALVRAHTRTLRLSVDGEDRLREHLAAGERVLFASWHQRFYAGIGHLRPYKPAIMISQSTDGDIIARIAKAIGWNPVRGSTSRGGAIAMAGMIDCVSANGVGGHIVDGPRGPARTIKPGLIRIAQRARASIMPVYVGYARSWEARSWDRFQVPLPFTRVLIRFGRLIDVPEEMSSERFADWCRDLDVEFAHGYGQVDADVREGWTADRSIATARAT